MELKKVIRSSQTLE